eukprot:3863460-Pyramimonas_sp.AAC.1
MVFWEHEEHEVAYNWLRAFKIVAREWCSGNTKNTKWPTVSPGHSKSRNGVLGTRRSRSGLQLALGSQNHPQE